MGVEVPGPRGGDPGDGPIFVVGMPRSGTTLLSAMLSAHPRIAIAPETHFFDRWLMGRRLRDLANRNACRALWRTLQKDGLPERFGVDPDAVMRRIDASRTPGPQAVFTAMIREFAAIRDKPRWGEKTPGHYLFVDRLLSWYPDARVLFLVRDPRAVVLSLLEMPWTHGNAAMHALRWRDAARLLQRLHHSARVRPVRYERLVHEPRQVLENVCAFVGEPFRESMVRPGAHATSLVGGEWWKARALRTVSPERVDRWRERLTPAQISLVHAATRREMRSLGYVTPRRASIRYRARILAVRARSRLGWQP